ncbi:MAG: RNA polymerase sigma factor [Actinomycetota bacterium]
MPGPTLQEVDTDLDLLHRLQEGDEQAFVELVSRYQQPMLRLARTLVPSHAVAEEAVQDAWMGVVRGIERFEGRSSLKTWLFRILANRAKSAGAVEQRQVPVETRAIDAAAFNASGQWANPVQPWVDDVENRLDAQARSGLLKAALDGLPARQRQVVLLRDVEDLSSDEVCAVLSISAGNQRILLHRGRHRLRDALDAVMREG